MNEKTTGKAVVDARKIAKNIFPANLS